MGNAHALKKRKSETAGSLTQRCRLATTGDRPNAAGGRRLRSHEKGSNYRRPPGGVSTNTCEVNTTGTLQTSNGIEHMM